MVKKNHIQLANALLEACGGLANRRHEWAFIYGSISPDCNPLTYFKGSIDYNFLHGHNYVNARRWMFRAIRRLQGRTHWTLWDYYTLGKVTHYLGDAFIFPHNEHYPHGPVGHRCYEVKFRSLFKVYVKDHPPLPCKRIEGAVEAVTKLHCRYMAEASTVTRDMDYIIQSAMLVMTACLPKANPAMAMGAGFMEAA